MLFLFLNRFLTVAESALFEILISSSSDRAIEGSSKSSVISIDDIESQILLADEKEVNMNHQKKDSQNFQFPSLEIPNTMHFSEEERTESFLEDCTIFEHDLSTKSLSSLDIRSAYSNHRYRDANPDLNDLHCLCAPSYESRNHRNYTRPRRQYFDPPRPYRLDFTPRKRYWRRHDFDVKNQDAIGSDSVYEAYEKIGAILRHSSKIPTKINVMEEQINDQKYLNGRGSMESSPSLMRHCVVGILLGATSMFVILLLSGIVMEE